jgi:HSP20 family protein
MSERSFGSFRRAVPLPAEIDEDRAEANFKNGVLSVRLPQSPQAQAKTRRIEVQGA